MSNHNGSHSLPELSGSITGVLESSWQSWLEDNREAFHIDDRNEAAVKYCFMCSAVSMYNLFMETLRQDPSMTLLTRITADMKKEFDQYFTRKGIN